MSIVSEISRLQAAKADIKTAIEDKGVAVPAGAKLDDYADLVAQISGGGGGGAPAARLTVTLTGDDTLVPWSTLQANGLQYTNWEDVFVAAIGRSGSMATLCSIARGGSESRQGLASSYDKWSGTPIITNVCSIDDSYASTASAAEAEEYMYLSYIITDAQGVHIMNSLQGWQYSSVVLIAIEITGVQ